jgi:hypothetical protein
MEMESDEIKYTLRVYRPTFRILPGHLEPDARPTPPPEIRRPERKAFFGFQDFLNDRAKVSISLLCRG